MSTAAKLGYTACTVILLFQIEDFSSLMTFMRYNDFENDIHAIVEGCEPERTPAGSVANRLDLSDPDSKCAFSEYDWMVGHSGYGALDAKLASKDSFLPAEELQCGESGTTIAYVSRHAQRPTSRY